MYRNPVEGREQPRADGASATAPCSAPPPADDAARDRHVRAAGRVLPGHRGVRRLVRRLRVQVQGGGRGGTRGAAAEPPERAPHAERHPEARVHHQRARLGVAGARDARARLQPLVGARAHH